jgi:hypothetical protein
MNPQIDCPAPSRRRLESETHVNVLKKLQHPVALVVQGFVVGGVLFWTTQGQAMQAPVAGPAPVVTSISAD